MKRNGSAPTEVCVVHSIADRVLAEAVADRFRQGEMLGTLYPFDAPMSDELGDRLRDAVDSSRAFAVILPRDRATAPGLLFAIGAAMSIDLPVLLFLVGPEPADMPDFMKRYPKYQLWPGFPKAVAAIRRLPDRVPA